MACCLLPFSGDPIEGEERRPNQWQVPLKSSPCAEPACCCFGFWCGECAAFRIRKKALETAGKWPHGYICCQGSFPAMCCFKPGEMGEADNAMCCLCLESFFCTGCSMSGTYMFTMRNWGLDNDPDYNRFVRLSNCLQMLACVCSLASICIHELRDAAECVRFIADIVFRTLMGCLNAQVEHELNHQTGVGKGGYATLPPNQPQAVQPGYAPQQGGYPAPPQQTMGGGGYPAPPQKEAV